LDPGANASAVKIDNVTSNQVRFEDKKYFLLLSYFGKRSSLLQQITHAKDKKRHLPGAREVQELYSCV
jgi:hypothetical protein